MAVQTLGKLGHADGAVGPKAFVRPVWRHWVSETSDAEKRRHRMVGDLSDRAASVSPVLVTVSLASESECVDGKVGVDVDVVVGDGGR